MKNKLTAAVLTCLFIFTACHNQKLINNIIEESLSFAVKQYTMMGDVMKDKPGLVPRTTDKEGNLIPRRTARTN